MANEKAVKLILLWEHAWRITEDGIHVQWFYPLNWESTCTFEIGKIAHAIGMSPSVEDARGGESTRGG